MVDFIQENMAEPVKEAEVDSKVERVEEEDDEEDLLDADVNEEPCQLGFAEEPLEDELLEDRLFPSKIGGRPVWLDYINLPSIESMKCGKCNHPMLLLLQMYLPSEESDDTYHRMVYVFCCRDGGCHISDAAKSFRVLRCQLPEKNALYSPDATDECDLVNDPDMVLNEKGRAMTCAICGCLADKRCSRCKGPAYCSREHQISHWSDPDAPHQKECGQSGSGAGQFDPKEFFSALLFEEFEVTTDPEPAYDAEKELARGKMLLRKYKKEEKRRLKKGIKDEFEYDDSFGTATKEVEIDPQFEKFQMRVSREPEQVIRFDGKSPLWSNSKNQPTDPAMIPPCANCGAARRFELQVMPQILFFLKSNDDVKYPIEFGTLAVYTCEKSCQAQHKDQPYLSEFLWRQNPV